MDTEAHATSYGIEINGKDQKVPYLVKCTLYTKFCSLSVSWPLSELSLLLNPPPQDPNPFASTSKISPRLRLPSLHASGFPCDHPISQNIKTSAPSPLPALGHFRPLLPSKTHPSLSLRCPTGPHTFPSSSLASPTSPSQPFTPVATFPSSLSPCPRVP